MAPIQPHPLRAALFWFVAVGSPGILLRTLIVPNGLLRAVLIVATGMVLPHLIVRWQQRRLARTALPRGRRAP